MHPGNHTDKNVNLSIIGVIATPHKEVPNMPIQPSGAEGIEGVAELFPEFTEGLSDLEGFSHIILLYHFHKIDKFKLTVKPFLDDRAHGVFATRSPLRPSAIGFSIVKLLKIDGGKVFFEGADMLNGTPLLDIKPYVRQFDNRPEAVSGWLDRKDENLVKRTRSDSRFL